MAHFGCPSVTAPTIGRSVVPAIQKRLLARVPVRALSGPQRSRGWPTPRSLRHGWSGACWSGSDRCQSFDAALAGSGFSCVESAACAGATFVPCRIRSLRLSVFQRGRSAPIAGFEPSRAPNAPSIHCQRRSAVRVRCTPSATPATSGCQVHVDQPFLADGWLRIFWAKHDLKIQRRRGRGRIASPLQHGFTEDGVEVRVDNDWRLHLASGITHNKETGEIHIRASSEEDADRLLERVRKHARRRGEEAVISSRSTSHDRPLVNIPVSTNLVVWRRMTAKIALGYGSIAYPEDWRISEAADRLRCDLREDVADANGNAIRACTPSASTKRISCAARGPPEHLVLLAPGQWAEPGGHPVRRFAARRGHRVRRFRTPGPRLAPRPPQRSASVETTFDGLMFRLLRSCQLITATQRPRAGRRGREPTPALPAPDGRVTAGSRDLARDPTDAHRPSAGEVKRLRSESTDSRAVTSSRPAAVRGDGRRRSRMNSAYVGSRPWTFDPRPANARRATGRRPGPHDRIDLSTGAKADRVLRGHDRDRPVTQHDTRATELSLA